MKELELIKKYAEQFSLLFILAVSLVACGAKTDIQQTAIIPRPVNITTADWQFRLPQQIIISYPKADTALKNAAEFIALTLSEKLGSTTHIEPLEPNTYANKATITISHTADDAYSGTNWNVTLLDGLTGTTRHNNGVTQGFNNGIFDVVIDLGQEDTIKQVSSSFFQFVREGVDISAAGDSDFCEQRWTDLGRSRTSKTHVLCTQKSSRVAYFHCVDTPLPCVYMYAWWGSIT